MRNSIVPTSVDAYLHALPEDQKAALEHLRRLIKETAPMAEEVISYQIPAYKYHGMLVYFAAYKNHCSLFAVNNHAFKEELKNYKTSKGTVQFTVDKPLPDDLVRRIVQFRMMENEALAKEKPEKKGKK